MGTRKRKAPHPSPMGTFIPSSVFCGNDEAVFEELPSLFGSSPKRVALDSHSSGLSSQSELLCGEWLGCMNLDTSFESSLQSSPLRTSNSSSASTDSLQSVATANEKPRGCQTGSETLHCRAIARGPWPHVTKTQPRHGRSECRTFRVALQHKSTWADVSAWRTPLTPIWLL